MHTPLSVFHYALHAMQTPTRLKYAVVTGANKGIGLETVRQLASQGVTVVLTARNEKRRMEALLKLQELGLSNIVFHQLDVLDPVSIKSLANFIQEKFGRLDIMVNNAGASGVVVDEDGLKALNIDPSSWLSGQVFKLIELHGVIETNYEKAEECLNTNYHGVRRVTEAVQPLLQLSPAGARIVNVSSLRSELKVKGISSIETEVMALELVPTSKRLFDNDILQGNTELPRTGAVPNKHILGQVILDRCGLLYHASKTRWTY
uniref:Uncharacterized protein n=1 Tax=Quercus lobata TaxID=97700 RepID=A0A7N2KNB8_QUELO